MKRYFITGIDTNVGKTLCSAILVEALKADYWKPIQSGTIEGTDANSVKNLISNSQSQFHKETYTFNAPVSPHLAAAIEHQTISMDNLIPPQTENDLIIEGAGGLMVPLNDKNFVVDIAKKIDAEVVLVIRNYLGCINHSLLSIDYLRSHKFKIKGLILNGEFDELVLKSILDFAQLPVILRIPTMEHVKKEEILDLSKKVRMV